MANFLTCIRILCSAAILFCPAMSPIFYILYLTAGVSDMLDGAAARKAGTASETGARLDTVADLIFVSACMIKLFPVLEIDVYIYVWVAVIAFIKISGYVYVYKNKISRETLHTAANRITGTALFILPLTLGFIDIKYTAPLVCAAATYAAIDELRAIRRDKNAV